MIEALSSVYNIAALVVFTVAAISAYLGSRWGLLRCAVASLIMFAFNYWAFYEFIAPKEWQDQPWLLSLGCDLLVFLVVMIRPRDWKHAVLGGSIIALMFCHLFAGVCEQLWGFSRSRDELYWLSIAGLSFAQLFIYGAWTGESFGKRAYAAGWRLVTRLGNKLGAKGVA